MENDTVTKKERPLWQLILAFIVLLIIEQGMNITFLDELLFILDDIIIGGAAIKVLKEVNDKRKRKRIEDKSKQP